ncbi:MAG: hypothetical protein J6C52_04785, partial [Clostridia bacterium]|nr:hypothetical protein [Clostridia bacterium]
LGKAFRPPRQLPDRPLRPWPRISAPSWRWGEMGVVFARSVDDTLLASCAQRPASAFGALELGAINVLTFFLRKYITKTTVNLQIIHQ